MGQKSRKIRALAAGGAVLGVGAAVTLAAWSDSEFAEGLFTTSDFGIHATTGGAPFSENPDTEQALELTFAGAEALAPGDTVAVDYQIKNVPDGADSLVTFEQQNISGALDGALTAQVVQTTDATCTPETTGTELPTGGTFELIAQDPQNLCLQVSLAEGYSEVDSAQSSIVWQFDAAELEDTETGDTETGDAETGEPA